VDAFHRLRGLASTALLGVLVACGGGSSTNGTNASNGGALAEHEGASALSRAVPLHPRLHAG